MCLDLVFCSCFWCCFSCLLRKVRFCVVLVWLFVRFCLMKMLISFCVIVCVSFGFDDVVVILNRLFCVDVILMFCVRLVMWLVMLWLFDMVLVRLVLCMIFFRFIVEISVWWIVLMLVWLVCVGWFMLVGRIDCSCMNICVCDLYWFGICDMNS